MSRTGRPAGARERGARKPGDEEAGRRGSRGGPSGSAPRAPDDRPRARPAPYPAQNHPPLRPPRVILDRMNVTGRRTTATARAPRSPVAAA
ncbi:predicted protein [Streptomyces sp. SPB78]|nr:predicted protein [Streptomyces sp. SPB78]